MTDERYHINIVYSDEDEASIADIPDLQYCSTFGETPNEAPAEVLIAQRPWLESAREHGQRSEAYDDPPA
ncbi:MAG: type II toxin-antitoxin system HicB family antitoxin [Chloroflexi bacterium]|nr:MAG: type II toxin-antitoxin system HicB family antitoxin [Chloroflexota bacterium]